MFSGSTSPNDAAVFTGHHANVDRSHMTWMVNTYDDLADDLWRYPSDRDDWTVDNADHLNGPFAVADVLGCSGGGDFDMYDSGRAWKHGTLLDDTVNPGFPFTDLWDEPPENGVGYTHHESTYPMDDEVDEESGSKNLAESAS